MKLRAVVVISQDPIGIESDTSGTLPAHVQFAIPATIAPGKYFLTAMGATTDGQSVDSGSVEIDVEYDSAPVLVLPEGNRVSFLTPGERLPTHVIGRFGQTSVDVARSTRVTFTSSDPTVAAVGLEGWISSVSPGTATITIAYGPPRRPPVQTTVSVDVRSPMLSASKYLLDFGTQPVGATGESQSLTLTNNSIGPIRAIKITTTPLYAQTNDCPAEIPSKASCTVTVTFTPRERGDQPGTLSITNSFSAIPTEIRLSGTGR